MTKYTCNVYAVYLSYNLRIHSYSSTTTLSAWHLSQTTQYSKNGEESTDTRRTGQNNRCDCQPSLSLNWD